MTAEVQTQMLLQDRTLREIMRRLAQVYQPERIYLFGSRARGDFRPDSDYDLLVIVPDDVPPEQLNVYDALRDLKVATSVMVHSTSYSKPGAI